MIRPPSQRLAPEIELAPRPKQDSSSSEPFDAELRSSQTQATPRPAEKAGTDAKTGEGKDAPLAPGKETAAQPQTNPFLAMFQVLDQSLAGLHGFTASAEQATLPATPAADAQGSPALATALSALAAGTSLPQPGALTGVAPASSGQPALAAAQTLPSDAAQVLADKAPAAIASPAPQNAVPQAPAPQVPLLEAAPQSIAPTVTTAITPQAVAAQPAAAPKEKLMPALAAPAAGKPAQAVRGDAAQSMASEQAKPAGVSAVRVLAALGDKAADAQAGEAKPQAAAYTAPVAAQPALSAGAAVAKPQAVAAQVLPQIKAALAKPGASLVVQLDPPNLGKVRMTVTETSTGVDIRLEAETPAAAAALREGGHEINSLLSAEGYRGSRIEVTEPRGMNLSSSASHDRQSQDLTQGGGGEKEREQSRREPEQRATTQDAFASLMQ